MINVQNQVAMKILRDTDFVYKLKEKIGLIKSAKMEKEKMSHQLPLPKLDY